MADEIKQFRTAAKTRGQLRFMIDDETFRLAPVGLNVADLVAELQGQLPARQAAGATPSADELVQQLQPLIDPEDYDRFLDYCKRYVMPNEFADIVRYVVGVITGRDPTRPASSPGGSSSNGAPSPDGASHTASNGQSSSRSQTASTPTSSRSASGPTKNATKKSTARSNRRTG